MNKFAILLGIFAASYTVEARAEHWQLIGSDKDALGEDMRSIEIDLDSIHVAIDDISVKERSTTRGIQNTGYNCAEGEIRHGNVDKDVKEKICPLASSGRRYDRRAADWKPLHPEGSAGQEFFDLNSVFRTNDEVFVTQMRVQKAVSTGHYDCKGYYGDGHQWTTLDVTDHVATVPRGYVSLERKISNQVCALRPSK